jgi:hypothetical protein
MEIHDQEVARRAEYWSSTESYGKSHLEESELQTQDNVVSGRAGMVRSLEIGVGRRPPNQKTSTDVTRTALRAYALRHTPSRRSSHGLRENSRDIVAWTRIGMAGEGRGDHLPS